MRHIRQRFGPEVRFVIMTHTIQLDWTAEDGLPYGDWITRRLLESLLEAWDIETIERDDLFYEFATAVVFRIAGTWIGICARTHRPAWNGSR